MEPTKVDKEALENFEAHANELFAKKREEVNRIQELILEKQRDEIVKELKENHEQEKIKSMIKDLIGKRLLVTYTGHYRSTIDELKIVELSPSGNWVKVMNLHGNKYWKAVSEIAIVEVLTDLKEERPKE